MSAISDIPRPQALVLQAMLSEDAVEREAAASRFALEVAIQEEIEFADLRSLEQLGLIDGERMGVGEDRSRHYWLTDAGYLTAREYSIAAARRSPLVRGARR